MTSTAAADPRAITEEHRLAQLKIRTAALRDFLVLWPLWDGNAATFNRLVLATLPLVNVYRDASSSLASAYMESVRSSQSVPGDAVARAAAAIDPRQLAASMYATGQVAARESLTRGARAADVRNSALAGVSGAVSRHVLNAGRQTVIDSVAADPHALGWARVTDSAPCAFCAMLAARGAVYKSEHTADFHAHDHCGCSIMPVYRDSRLPQTSLRWRDLYNRAQRDAEASGELDRGTSNDRLNAFRRALEAE